MCQGEREGGREEGKERGGDAFLSVVFPPKPPNKVNFVLKC